MTAVRRRVKVEPRLAACLAWSPQTPAQARNGFAMSKEAQSEAARVEVFPNAIILIIRTVVNVENIATHLETLFFVLLR